RAVAAELGEAAIFIELDVTKADSWCAAVDQVESRLGPINVLVNNAAKIEMVSFEELDETLFRQVFEVNELGCFLGMKAVAPSMRRAGHGSIINVSSIAGLAVAGGVAYSASKWAIRGMT